MLHFLPFLWYDKAMKQNASPHLGCHLSATRGFAGMGKDALSIGADTFQFFLRNPRGSRAKRFDPGDVDSLNRLLAEHAFAPIVAHAPYTLNICAVDASQRAFALQTVRDDLFRMDHIRGGLYNLHPGSNMGLGARAGMRRAAELLTEALPGPVKTTVLLETMPGQGSSIGKTFEELAELLALLPDTGRFGVCLDTCHVFAAGYDIKNDLDGVLAAFDRSIGLSRLRCVHLNDSMTPFNSGHDRHARVGEGEIGLDALRRIAYHEALFGIPMILETPNDLAGHATELRLLRGME